MVHKSKWKGTQQPTTSSKAITYRNLPERHTNVVLINLLLLADVLDLKKALAFFFPNVIALEKKKTKYRIQ